MAELDEHPRVGAWGATAVVAGTMIGSGVYLLPASMGALGSISILGWVTAGAVAVVLAAVFAWLARLAPEAQGLPGYVQAGLGRFSGVVTAAAYWAACLVSVVAVAVAAAGYAAFVVPALAPAGPRMATTLMLIWMAVGVTWIGPRLVAGVQQWTLLLGLLPVLAAATAGWFWFDPQVFADSWNPQHFTLSAAVGKSTLAAFWAFLGLEAAAAIAGVVRDPARNVPRATLVGVALAGAIYVSACAVLMGVLSSERLAASNAPYGDAAGVILGVGFGVGVAACAFLRASGSLTALVLETAETSRSGADEGAFLRVFRTRPGEAASATNLLFIGVLMTGLALMTATPRLADQFSVLANVTVLLCLFTYMLAAGSLASLSRRLASRPRALAALLCAVAIGACLAVISTARPVELAWSLAPLLAGALAFVQIRRESPA